MLRAGIGRDDRNSRRKMGQPDGGIGDILVLPSRPAGPIRLDDDFTFQHRPIC